MPLLHNTDYFHPLKYRNFMRIQSFLNMQTDFKDFIKIISYKNCIYLFLYNELIFFIIIMKINFENLIL